MFAALAKLDKSGAPDLDLSADSSADLLGEFRTWLTISATAHEGPWQRARQLHRSIDDRRVRRAVGGIGRSGFRRFRRVPGSAGGTFPPEWLREHINLKEKYALFHLLQQFCEVHPEPCVESKCGSMWTTKRWWARSPGGVLSTGWRTSL